jgi:hypothetical protein
MARFASCVDEVRCRERSIERRLRRSVRPPRALPFAFIGTLLADDYTTPVKNAIRRALTSIP